LITHGVFFLICPYHTTLYKNGGLWFFKNISSKFLFTFGSKQIVDGDFVG
jgi:hypothetical protein